MTKDFYTKHKDTINAIIEGGQVKYASSSGAGTNTVVHCYYVEGKKGTRISAYAMKNKVSRTVYKHILKMMITSDTKNHKSVSVARDTDKYAERIFDILAAKYTEQIARTQLKKNWHNPSFAQKR